MRLAAHRAASLSHEWRASSHERALAADERLSGGARAPSPFPAWTTGQGVTIVRAAPCVTPATRPRARRDGRPRSE